MPPPPTDQTAVTFRRPGRPGRAGNARVRRPFSECSTSFPRTSAGAFDEVEGARVGGDSRTVIVSGLASASRAACAIV
jgi:hypothetical protein